MRRGRKSVSLFLDIFSDLVMSSQTQASLLERLRDAADPMAWDEFFARYWRLIHRFARLRGQLVQSPTRRDDDMVSMPRVVFRQASPVHTEELDR